MSRWAWALQSKVHVTKGFDRASWLQVHRIPVVDEKARCIGIVTRTDIFTALALEVGNTSTLA